ncbi:DUF2797 domain-containing protein [Frigoriflavimonas asaccharolytica]|uniref:DUF2797 domain-containing protein n=1 Tax=Frigoriflavimonas asaccharolytica TaxID=2735899 RepID=A0A8J8GCU8_9FLAO|nr:DUF2797 domain-containing protein [Frigoriflavimonas asaccharolytica]NRS93397.1 hypothetical protein [Frigoriflavimonas asaccharolytica]
MLFKGQLLKMSTQYASPIQYYLNLSDDLLNMNQLFNKKISIKHTGYQCVNCGRNEKLYRMGFCKKCFFESPYASESIIRPELSTAHLGTEERDIAVEEQIQLVPHIVYLAYTGEIKVGVTREKQIPTRWIDQGATFALEIARTENRYEAGMIEVALKEHVADKTNWRKMLKDEMEGDLDLEDFRNKVKENFPEEFEKFYSGEEKVWKMDFPYEANEKISSVNLEKTPEFEGVLKGIKGQYLSFEDGSVMNVRSHEGFVVEVEI